MSAADPAGRALRAGIEGPVAAGQHPAGAAVRRIGTRPGRRQERCIGWSGRWLGWLVLSALLCSLWADVLAQNQRLQFNSYPIGTPGGTLVVTVRNSDSVPRTVVVDTDAHDCVDASGCAAPAGWYSDFLLDSTCPRAPAALGAGKACLALVAFTPVGEGVRSGRMRIQVDGSEPRIIDLGGTGEAVVVHDESVHGALPASLSQLSEVALAELTFPIVPGSQTVKGSADSIADMFLIRVPGAVTLDRVMVTVDSPLGPSGHQVRISPLRGSCQPDVLGFGFAHAGRHEYAGALGADMYAGDYAISIAAADDAAAPLAYSVSFTASARDAGFVAGFEECVTRLGQAAAWWVLAPG